MDFLRNTVRKAVFWTYPRTSWQWDVLCVLILVFIFLTPKSWFENSAYQRSHTGQTKVVLGADVIGAQVEKAEIERRARELAGRPNGEIREVRPLHDASGRLTGYEVDIR